jgi:NADPH:quinone reductase-like Zn-dependent oxidoreductase
MISGHDITDKVGLVGKAKLAQISEASGCEERFNVMLDRERIVVLGGSSGIGLATAQAAAREGAFGKLSALRWVLGDGWDMLDT